MRVIISGARGYIGAAVLRRLRIDGICHLPLSSSTQEQEGFGRLDLAKPESFSSIAIQKNDCILLMAAISSPDVCAKNPELVWRVNVEGTSKFISHCINTGARVIFFSSDTVYGEREDEFDESAICNPSGEYAKMKHAVEKQFIANPSFRTVRLSYVFSKDDKFTKYLTRCAEQGIEAEIFHPFDRAVVHREDVAQGVIELARRWTEFPQSVINFGGPEVTERPAFANILKEIAMPSLRFRRTEPGPEFFMNRPRVIRMKSPLLSLLLNRSPRTLRDAALFEFDVQGKERNV